MTMLRRFLITFIAALLTQSALANPPATPSAGKSWISTSFPFDKDLPVTRQAQQWAMCSATLEVFSEFIKNEMGKPDTATAYKNFSNGAAIAIIGVFIRDLANRAEQMSGDELVDKMQQTIKYSQFASKDYTAAAKTQIGMMRENSSNKNQFMEDLIASSKSCTQKHVLDMQQIYIDAARQLLLGVGG